MTVSLAVVYRRYHTENQRLEQNQTALHADITHYRTRLGQEAASVQALRLRCTEFKKIREADAETIRRLGIKIRRLEATAKLVTETKAEIQTPLRDTIVLRLRDTTFVQDTVRLFRWHDPWIALEGYINRDSVACAIRSIDTLRQVVHRIPRRFLFIRWGTKALRQEIISSNPHTRIVYATYVKIER